MADFIIFTLLAIFVDALAALAAWLVWTMSKRYMVRRQDGSADGNIEAWVDEDSSSWATTSDSDLSEDEDGTLDIAQSGRDEVKWNIRSTLKGGRPTLARYQLHEVIGEYPSHADPGHTASEGTTHGTSTASPALSGTVTYIPPNPLEEPADSHEQPKSADDGNDGLYRTPRALDWTVGNYPDYTEFELETQDTVDWNDWNKAGAHLLSSRSRHYASDSWDRVGEGADLDEPSWNREHHSWDIENGYKADETLSERSALTELNGLDTSPPRGLSSDAWDAIEDLPGPSSSPWEPEENTWNNHYKVDDNLSEHSLANPDISVNDLSPPSTTVPRVFDNEEDALAYSLSLVDGHVSETAGDEVEVESVTPEETETPAYELGNLEEIMRMLEAKLEDWIPFTPEMVLDGEDEEGQKCSGHG